MTADTNNRGMRLSDRIGLALLLFVLVIATGPQMLSAQQTLRPRPA